MLKNNYIDAHLHLLDKKLDGIRETVVKRAVASGVAKMICNAVAEEDWPGVATLAGQYEQVIACYGVHPWYADRLQSDWLERLESFVQKSGGGVGEIGLDGLVQVAAKCQEEVFCAQLDLAIRTGKPAMIHCVKRWGRIVEIVETFDLTRVAMLFHSFGGSKEILIRLLDKGAYFSFSSLLADPTRKKMRQVFQEVPLDRLFLETDAPDQYTPLLFPEPPGRGGGKHPFSEPAHIVDLYDLAAAMRQINPEALREQVWKNGQIFTN